MKTDIKNRKDNVSDNLCTDCKSECCHDLVMEIDSPKNHKDLETLKWYLHFENSFIFIYQNTWYQMFRSRCRYMDKKTMLCLNYENRSDRCREHNPPKCERYDKWYDILFDDKKKLEDYVYSKKILKPKNSKR